MTPLSAFLPSSVPSPSFPSPVPSTDQTSQSSAPAASASPIPPTTSAPSATSPSSSSVPPSSSYVLSSSAASQLTPSPSTTTPPPSSTSAAPYSSSALAAPLADVQPSSSSIPPTSLASASVATPVSPSSLTSSTSPTPSSSQTVTQSPTPGFFSNTAAVAGTFTVVGLVGVASLIAVIMFVVRRHRHSRSYEEDTEFLDKGPDLSTDPPMTVTSHDEGSSEHAHYATTPMTLPTPPAAYYPDHAYALHPQAFSAVGYAPPASQGYPVGYTRNYPAQHIYSTEDYNMAYALNPARVDPNIPIPREHVRVGLDSAPVPSSQPGVPNALRPSVRLSPTVRNQRASSRYSVDSFYAGIASDAPLSSGRAL